MSWIRGPRSALTDYLASQNVSASQIRADNQARRAAAATGTQDEDVEDSEGEEEEVAASTTASIAARQALDRKRKNEAATIKKIKNSRAFKRRKRNDDDADELALAMFNEGEMAPVPGQMENCEHCQKRFTVTAYSRAGPGGDLLCPKCSSKLVEEEKATKKKGKKNAATGPVGRGRREIQSQLLDGQIGVKNLMALCVETLAKNISLANDLGDLPAPAIDRVARQLAKCRLLDSYTLELFVQPQAEKISLYDAAKLGSDDFIRIFQICSNLKDLKLRNAIQFKDNVMEYLIGRHIALDSLHLHGANLVSDASWKKYLKKRGKSLKDLRVAFTDRHFGDKIVKFLKLYCPSLTRLKICHNQQVSDKGVKHIANLQNLEHLSLQLVKETSAESYAEVIRGIGSKLNTFSIRMVPGADDSLLVELHKHCASLTKLRITHSNLMTDAGFVWLFEDWKNKPLLFIDLQLCRHLDAERPRRNLDDVGLCSNGFRALMQHSGKRLIKLNVHGCRHISREAFEEVFSVDKVYPDLLELEISFCEEVTDFIVGSIFRSCPKLKMMNVFGCMKVKEVRVPKGKILVGVPTALGMVIEGTED
ncbi:RNI-like protein [Hypoxylon crocopeplum]|nr:RNI-like protein [Hypoxylon crocopeplum]